MTNDTLGSTVCGALLAEVAVAVAVVARNLAVSLSQISLRRTRCLSLLCFSFLFFVLFLL